MAANFILKGSRMKKTQQERLEKRILNIINNDLKFLEKSVIVKDYFGVTRYPIILKGNKTISELEEEGLQIVKDVFSSVDCELETALRFAFKYEKIVFKYEKYCEKNFRIDFKRIDSKNLCIRIEMIELDNEEGYYFKPFIMIH